MNTIPKFCSRLALYVPAMLLCTPLCAFAEDGHHESGGLPQFDPSTYSSQLFWLAVTFALLYVHFSRKTLPEIASVIENRQDRIRSDLEKAERLKGEAEQAQKAYDKLLGDARAEATRLTTGAMTDVKTDMARQLDKFRKKAEDAVAAQERELTDAHARIMKEIDGIAAEAASAAAAKIVGIEADIRQARTVVQSINRREAA